MSIGRQTKFCQLPILLVCVTFCALTLSKQQRSAAQTLASSIEARGNGQVLVLKNGEILRGRIEQDQASLIVHTQQGSRLVIPKTKADFICNSLEEAFWGKSAQTRASDARAQIELFRWCLKHRQIDLAEIQLEVLMQCEVSARELVSLNRQLSGLIRLQQLRVSETAANQLANKPAQALAPIASPSQSQLIAQKSTKIEPQLQFQPLPDLAPAKSVVALKSLDPESVISTDGQVLPASFVTPINPKELSTSATRLPKLAAEQSGFSTAASIPDLSVESRRGKVKSQRTDPYDAAEFNSETKRKLSEATDDSG